MWTSHRWSMGGRKPVCLAREMAHKGNSSLCLPVSPTVSDRVGGDGSEIARQEAKAAELVYWHTQ